MDYSWLILIRRLSKEESDRNWPTVQQHWDAFRSQMIENDEIWEYECSINHRHELSGTSGVCLKRDRLIFAEVAFATSLDKIAESLQIYAANPAARERLPSWVGQEVIRVR